MYIVSDRHSCTLLFFGFKKKQDVNKFPFSEIEVNETCDPKDSKPCVEEHAKCSNNHGYTCLCSDTYYHKGNKCESRM